MYFVFTFFFFFLKEKQMADCNSVTVFAAIGAAYIGYKVFTLLKTLFDVYVAPGISVR